MTIITEARNADLSDLVAMLRRQQDVKFDVVVPAAKLRSSGGEILVPGSQVSVFHDELRFVPTANMDGDVAEKLGIPLPYLRRLRAERVDLYDANVNGWLRGGVDAGGRGIGPHGEPAVVTGPAAPDQRRFLLRTFIEPGEHVGIGRALLSDTYKAIDNLDTLMACLQAINQEGIHVNVVNANLTETRMSVYFDAPEITAMAPILLGNYRNPFDTSDPRWATLAGRYGWTETGAPIVSAGMVLSNGETGGSALILTPRFTMQTCLNGQTRQVDAMRTIHLGTKLDDGVIRVSDETREKALELAVSKTRDAVRTFLDHGYLARTIAALEAKAGVPVTNAVETIEVVSKALRYSEDRQQAILDQFVRGGQMTAGGVMHAVTAHAQTVPNADDAYDLEAQAFEVLDLAAAAQR